MPIDRYTWLSLALERTDQMNWCGGDPNRICGVAFYRFDSSHFHYVCPRW